MKRCPPHAILAHNGVADTDLPEKKETLVQEERKMNCPYCNNNIPDGYAACPSCGATFGAGQQYSCGCAENVNMFTPFTKYAQFAGRSRRKEYWLWVLLGFIVGIVCTFLGEIGSIISGVWNLAALIPGIAVTVRRLHDTGRSGWNYLWVLLPFIGWIILLIFVLQDSQPGFNQYGPNPKGDGNNTY